jgi:hypothetical protein
MPTSPMAVRSDRDNFLWPAHAELLARYPIFRACDLECVCHYLTGVLGPHRLTYWTRERRLDFRHRVAKMGAAEVNAIQAGPGAERIGPSRERRRFGHFGRDCARVRVSQPVRGRLQSALPRVAFRTPATRHRRTVSYWVTATSTVAISNDRFTPTPDGRGTRRIAIFPDRGDVAI